METPSFFCEITRIILPRRIRLILGVQEPVKLTGNVNTFLGMNDIFSVFYLFFFISNVISVTQMQLQLIPSQSCCGK